MSVNTGADIKSPWRMYVALVSVLIALAACSASDTNNATTQSLLPCSVEWYQFVEDNVVSSDGQGHGPDLGTDEWKSVVEFKLGIRGAATTPARDSTAWCGYIDGQIKARVVSAGKNNTAASTTPPSDCQRGATDNDNIAKLICSDDALAELDRSLQQVVAQATVAATDQQPAMLAKQQANWMSARSDCGQADDKQHCLADSYQHRIAELQARYQLVESNGPYYFSCDNNRAGEVLVTVVVTHFKTTPATLMATMGDDAALMYQQRSASGSRYQGRNESFWEHHGEALITWGYGAPELRCRQKIN